jgi:hypothetical protein
MAESLADVVLIDEAHHFRNPGRRSEANKLHIIVLKPELSLTKRTR